MAVPVAAVVATAALAGALLVATRPGSGRSPQEPPLPASVRHLAGRIIAEAADGTPLVSLPDASHQSAVRPGPVTTGARPVLVERDGEVVWQAHGSLSGAFYPGASTAGTRPDSLADRATAAIVPAAGAGPATTTPVSLVSLSDGARTSLGAANDAVGDPRTRGAFVSVAAAVQPAGRSAGVDSLADSEVALRQSSGQTTVLATATQLDRDAGIDPRQAVNLTLYPDPDGGKIAVVLNPVGTAPGTPAGTPAGNPVGTSAGNAAMVVLDRRGHRLGSLSASTGPAEYSALYWSPNGESVAFASFNSVGSALAVMSPDYRVVTQSVQPGTRLGHCAWSPDGAWVLCQAAFDSSTVSVVNWVLARNDAGLDPVYSIPASGDPVAWIP
ncbi:MAG: hypothetical protein KGQ66_20910 [Acidobacteriota bacterium]|nr:hypothetical protein [Acidobacteriota bacterium]